MNRRTITTPTVYSMRNTIVSMVFVLGIIFLLVPWQVAFLGCWIFQLFTCAAFRVLPSSVETTPSTPELLQKPDDVSETSPPFSASRRADDTHKNANEHLLLLMTWLLPLAAPVLAVWVRTLMMAGYTTPFDGDHNVLYVAPFLIMVEMGAGRAGFMMRYVRRLSLTAEPDSCVGCHSRSQGKLSSLARHSFWLLVVVSAVFGPRYTYVVFECASVVCGVVGLASILAK